MTSLFFGEFGIASMPVWESVQRYLPDDEKSLWPPKPGGAFEYHTPIFNRALEMERLWQYAGYFTAGATMERFILGTQLAQVVGVRHTLERSRTRWPDCTGALMYKLNDNYPAASWSTLDWYGAAKPAHWFVQDAFAPVHACVVVPKLNIAGEQAELPVFLLDDQGALDGRDWSVRVRAFDQNLALVHEKQYAGERSSGTRVRRLGDFSLSAEQTKAAPLLLVVDWKSGEKHGRTFYWLNFEAKKDSLFELPATSLALATHGGKVRVENTGALPAVAVLVLRPGHLDTFTISDNYFWLDAGESVELEANDTTGLTVSAWNRV